MIEVGTRVQWTDDSGVGTVTQIKRRTFVVAWDDHPATTVWEYEYYHLADSNGDGFYIKVVPSEPVTEAPGDKYRDATIERLAYNCGAMEFELVHLWQRLDLIIRENISHNWAPSVNALTDLTESIERCADRLKPKTMTDGTVETPYLAAQIYANRK